MTQIKSWISLPEGVLNQLFAHLEEGVVILDENGQIILVNPAMETLLARTTPEIQGKPIQNFIEGLPKELIFKEGQSTGDVFLNKTGGNRTLLKYGLYTAYSSNFNGSILLLRDLSLSQRHAGLINLFESDILGILFSDIHNRIFEANDTFLNMVGYTREDLQANQLGWRDMTPPEYKDMDEAALQQLKKYGRFWPFEKQYIGKDGRRIDVLVGGVMEEGTHENCIAFALDITAKKQTERALIEGEKRFRAMADTASMMVGLINAEQKLIYTNKKSLEYLGGNYEEVINTSWIPYIHPEDLPRIMAMLQDSYPNRKYFQYECRLRRADGMYRWILGDGSPIVADGEFIGFLGTAIDIHDRKESEKALLDYAQRLEQSNKELEHFATIASHDLQEPLRKVMLFSEHLKFVSQGVLNTEALDDIERMQRATQRMQGLISDLLDLSRITRRGHVFKSTDIAYVLREVLADLSYKIKESQAQINIETESLPVLEADSSQMHQMFYQLIDNALTFSRAEVTPIIHISAKPRNATSYEITVSDNGQGFRQEYAERIFDTFVRLHHTKDYPGTGIGLALVRKIVERHGGTIVAEGIPGQGATFRIILPSHHSE